MMRASILWLFSLLSLTGVLAQTKIILPLYSLPGTAQWTSLTSSAAQYSSLTFIAIIDVSNGPGSSSPTSAWISGMQSLNSYSNILTIGYVYTSYGSRTTSAVDADVLSWAAWPSGSAPKGIFFDETAVPDNAAYYTNVTSYAKSVFPGGTLFLNPGTVPSTNVYFSLVNEVMIHEESYSQYESAGNSGVPSGPPYSQFSLIIYSVPSTGSTLSNLVATFVSKGYGSIYLTNTGDSYSSLGSDWSTFVGLVNSANSGTGPSSTTSTTSSSSTSTTKPTSATSSTKTTSSTISTRTTSSSSRSSISTSSSSTSTRRHRHGG